eukprot:3767794-Pleurochrysis_carterae.AAC.1
MRVVALSWPTRRFRSQKSRRSQTSNWALRNVEMDTRLGRARHTSRIASVGAGKASSARGTRCSWEDGGKGRESHLDGREADGR